MVDKNFIKLLNYIYRVCNSVTRASPLVVCRWNASKATTTFKIRPLLLSLSTLSLFLFLFLSPPACLGMRLVLQRVKSASVSCEGSTISSIGPGILALCALKEGDTTSDLEYCAQRLVKCKLWENEGGKPWRKSVKQMNYHVLLVSQFTLYGKVDGKKGAPDYSMSMKASPARESYESFKAMVASRYGEGAEGEKVKDGVFGGMMDVSLVNDGPVTLIIDSEAVGAEEASDERGAGSSK